jgi:hypothetical protein
VERLCLHTMSARAAGGMRSGIHQSSLAASFGGSARAEVAERVAAAGERTAHEQNLVANPGLRLAQIWRRVTAGPAAPAEQIARDVAEHSLLGAQVGDTIPAAEGGGGPAAAAQLMLMPMPAMTRTRRRRKRRAPSRPRSRSCPRHTPSPDGHTTPVCGWPLGWCALPRLTALAY